MSLSSGFWEKNIPSMVSGFLLPTDSMMKSKHTKGSGFQKWGRKGRALLMGWDLFPLNNVWETLIHPNMWKHSGSWELRAVLTPPWISWCLCLGLPRTVRDKCLMFTRHQTLRVVRAPEQVSYNEFNLEWKEQLMVQFWTLSQTTTWHLASRGRS